MKYFFIHIPKTAGTSLRELLYRNVAPELRLSVYPGNENDPSWVSYEKLCLNPESYQDRQYFIGHFNYGLHRILGVPDAECRYLTLLRNPVPRVVSLYKHFLSFPGSPEHDLIIDGQLSLLQFLQHGQASYQAINHMTKILADRDMAHKIDETDFEQAIWNIGQHFSFIGCTDDYLQTMAAICNLLGWQNQPKIHVNAALIKEPMLDAEGRVEQLIKTLNPYDMALYEYCRSHANGIEFV